MHFTMYLRSWSGRALSRMWMWPWGRPRAQLEYLVSSWIEMCTITIAGSSVGSSLTEGSVGSSSLTSMMDLEGEGEGDRLSERITSRLGVAPELSEREPERDVDLVVTLLLLGPVF